MVDVLLYSENEVFLSDLIDQFKRFVENVSFKGEKPDLIIVDENAEKYDALRQEFPFVPMILLSCGDDGRERNNLNICIKKPFVLNSLIDNIKSANNRLDNSSEGFLVFNQYELRPNKKEIFDIITEKTVKLTEKEVDILKYLYKNNGRFVDKNDLQKNVWQYNEDVTTHTIETHIYRLRQKVEKFSARKLIVTENGRYKLNQNE